MSEHPPVASGMAALGISLCLEPTDMKWGLGRLPGDSTVSLLGWRQRPASVDAGVPPRVAALIARVFTSFGKVSFLASSNDLIAVRELDAGCKSRLLPALDRGSIRALLQGLRGRRPDMYLCTTDQPAVAQRLFISDDYPWWLQRQLMLMTSSAWDPLACSTELVDRLLSPSWQSVVAALRKCRVHAAVRPGVDGDVAALLWLNERLRYAVIASLQKNTLESGVEWAVLDEAAFSSWLAGDSLDQSRQKQY